MKQTIKMFFLRGLVAGGFGPLLLAILYTILWHHDVLHTLTVNQVCMGIFSLYVLAFIAGGMNIIYQLERLPLMVAILIHGLVLYVTYLATYLLNDWLEWGTTPILVFSGIFVAGYLAVWAVIYAATKRNTAKLNSLLKEKQRRTEIP